MISLHYDNKLKFVSANIRVRRGLMIQNGVKMELKFRGFKVSTKITKIKTPRNFQRIRYEREVCFTPVVSCIVELNVK